MKKMFDIDIVYEKTKKLYMFFYIVYFIMIFIETTTLIVDYPKIVFIVKIVKMLMYICFIGRVCIISPQIIKDIRNIKFNNKKAIIVFLCLIFGVSIIGNLIATGNRRLLFLLIVVLSSYDINCEYIIKKTAKLQIALTCIIVALSILGVTQNYTVGRGEIIRYSLGFVYTTNLSQLVVFSIILLLYTKSFKTSNNNLLYIQLLNLLVYFLTNSRTEFILLECVIFICVLNQLKTKELLNKTKNILSKVFVYTFPIYPIISFVCVCLYPKGGIFNIMNSVLSNRLAQTYEVFAKNGISAFGKDIVFIGNGITDKLKYGYNVVSNYVDNEYIQLLFSGGYIFILAFIVLIYFVLLYLLKNKEYKKICICAVYLLFGIINPRIVNILYSPIMFILFFEILSYLKGKHEMESKIEGEKE